MKNIAEKAQAKKQHFEFGYFIFNVNSGADLCQDIALNVTLTW